MATLQKFKLLATQCAVAGSPTRSPRRLPAGDEFIDRRASDTDSSENRRDGGVRRKLKDLLVASPSPPPPRLLEENGGDGGEETSRWSGGGGGGGLMIRRGGWRGLRTSSGSLRQRLLRRAWRPVLVTIPE
ncbi:hypothetical protein SSX86_031632 [Deinandra increscens subsp. villosa]|uniref:Uncharacterized protein n=1 Tax=Deinandra increscens subsp. villosa TaxID=3103831 RepID=A0AAP0C8K4_9ASTR